MPTDGPRPALNAGMTKWNRFLLVPALGALLSFGILGCGGGEGDDDEGPAIGREAEGDEDED